MGAGSRNTTPTDSGGVPLALVSSVIRSRAGDNLRSAPVALPRVARCTTDGVCRVDEARQPRALIVVANRVGALALLPVGTPVATRSCHGKGPVRRDDNVGGSLPVLRRPALPRDHGHR